MSKRNLLYRLLVTGALASAFLASDVGFDGFSPSLGLVGQAEAKVVIRRSTVYVAALPRGCVRSTFGGAVVWRCGKTYYQPYKGRYVVVYVN